MQNTFRAPVRAVKVCTNEAAELFVGNPRIAGDSRLCFAASSKNALRENKISGVRRVLSDRGFPRGNVRIAGRERIVENLRLSVQPRTISAIIFTTLSMPRLLLIVRW